MKSLVRIMAALAIVAVAAVSTVIGLKATPTHAQTNLVNRPRLFFLPDSFYWPNVAS